LDPVLRYVTHEPAQSKRTNLHSQPLEQKKLMLRSLAAEKDVLRQQKRGQASAREAG
jgi:hypothetical protein